MQDHLTVELRTVSPDEAHSWLHKHAFAGQRPLRRHHVRFLAQLMHNGHFRAGSSVDFAVCGEQRYLINGQHTLTALVQTGLPQDLMVVTHVCQSETDVAELYARYDRGLQRTPQDAVSPFGLRERLGLGSEAFNALYTAVGLLGAGFTPVSSFSDARIGLYMRDIEIRAALLADWGGEAQAFFEDIRGCPKYIFKFLLRQAVLSVALVTYRFTGADASDFWGPLAQDDGLARTDPRKTLLSFLQEKPTRLYAAHHYARYVSMAWNSAFHEAPRTWFRVMDALRPILLAGTPHTHRRHMVYVSERGAVLHDPMPMSVLHGLTNGQEK